MQKSSEKMTPSKVASYFFHIYYNTLVNSFKTTATQDQGLPVLNELYGDESTVAFAHADDKQSNAIGPQAIFGALKNLFEHVVSPIQGASIADFKIEIEKAYFVRSRSGSVVASTEGVLLFPTAEIPFNQTFHLVPTPQRNETYYISAECFHIQPTKKCAVPTPIEATVSAATTTTTTNKKSEEHAKPVVQQPQQQVTSAAAAVVAPTPVAKPAAKKSLFDALTNPAPAQPQQAAFVVSSEEQAKPRERRQPAAKRSAPTTTSAAEESSTEAPKPRGKRPQPQQTEVVAAAAAHHTADVRGDRRPRREQTTTAAAVEEKSDAKPQPPRPKRAPAAATAATTSSNNADVSSSTPAGPCGYAILGGTNAQMDFRAVRLAIKNMGFNALRAQFCNNSTQVVVELATTEDARRLVNRSGFILDGTTVLSAKACTREEFEKVFKK